MVSHLEQTQYKLLLSTQNIKLHYTVTEQESTRKQMKVPLPLPKFKSTFRSFNHSFLRADLSLRQYVNQYTSSDLIASKSNL